MKTRIVINDGHIDIENWIPDADGVYYWAVVVCGAERISPEAVEKIYRRIWGRSLPPTWEHDK